MIPALAVIAVVLAAACWACLAADRRANEHAAANRRIIDTLRSLP